jgi:hypothetical protein
MTQAHLCRINQILGDKLGRIPTGYANSGESTFQFKRSEELFMPIKCADEFEVETTPSGLVNLSASYKLEPQLPGEDCWAIARWTPPGWTPGEFDTFGEIRETRLLSPSEWREKYGDIGWNPAGSWIAVQQLRPGVEPTEQWARFAADVLFEQRTTSMRETVHQINKYNDRREQRRNERIQDELRSLWVNHVPGARGGSYLAFNEKEG